MNRITAAEQTGRQHQRVLGTAAAGYPGALGGVKVQPDGLKPTWSSPQALALSDRITTEIGREVRGSMEPSSGTLKIHRVDPHAQVMRTFETNNARIDLLRVSNNNSVELEFLTSCHSVLFLMDGLSNGCEWSDGQQTRRLSFLAPNVVVFNPAQNYLRIRAAISRNHCHFLMLAIRPELLRCCGDLEIDLAAVEFRQQVGLNDAQASQTLMAVEEELEAPGINGAFYVDAQLFLLLTRLMRRASNVGENSAPTYVKGGLPNWRLKRAIELLEGHSAKMPTLNEVAQVIGLHPTSFCRSFKQSTGLAPHHYILAHRVNLAKEMMNDQRLSLTEIALDCGFSGSSQFSVVFKRVTGISPREYRRAL